MNAAIEDVASTISSFPVVIRGRIDGAHCVFDECQSREELEAYLVEKHFTAGRDRVYVDPPPEILPANPG